MLSKTKSLTERGPLLPKTSLHPVVAAESYLKMELLLLLLERCFLLRFLGRYTLAQEVPGHPSTKFHKGISLMTAALMLAKRVSANFKKSITA